MGEITVQNIDRVLAFLPLFEDEDVTLYEVQVESLTMDPYLYSEQVIHFIGVLGREGFIDPFDWPAWQAEAKRYVSDPHLLETADLVTLQKLLTTHVRIDRFVSGHLAAMLDSGHIVSILKRLKAIRAELALAG